MPLKGDSVPDRTTIIVFLAGLAVSTIAYVGKAYQKGSTDRPANFTEFIAGLFGAMLFGAVAGSAALEYLSVSFTGVLAINGAAAWLGADVFRWVVLRLITKYFKLDLSAPIIPVAPSALPTTITPLNAPTQGDPPT